MVLCRRDKSTRCPAQAWRGAPSRLSKDIVVETSAVDKHHRRKPCFIAHQVALVVSGGHDHESIHPPGRQRRDQLPFASLVLLQAAGERSDEMRSRRVLPMGDPGIQWSAKNWEIVPPSQTFQPSARRRSLVVRQWVKDAPRKPAPDAGTAVGRDRLPVDHPRKRNRHAPHIAPEPPRMHGLLLPLTHRDL